MLLSQILIGCSLLSQENCELIGLRMKVERNFHINMPYYSYLKSKPFASKIEDILRHTVITFTEMQEFAAFIYTSMNNIHANDYKGWQWQKNVFFK